MSIKIEIAGPSDAAEVAALHYLSHTTAFAAFSSPEWVQSRSKDEYLRQWQEFFTNNAEEPRSRAWKARDADGTLAGMVKVAPMDEREAQLTSMHVHPDFHRRGIGRQLMDTAVEFMRDVAGFETAILGVIEANTAARALYERGGWSIDQRRERGNEGVPYFIYRIALK